MQEFTAPHHRIRVSRANRRATLLVLFFAAYVSPAWALESFGNMFLWNDQASAPLNQDYIPNSNYRSNQPGDLTMGLRRTNTGQYSVTFGLPHEALHAVIGHVVAYGTDNVRCKFRKALVAKQCQAPGGGPGVCSELYVACYNGAGAATDSKFAIQIQAWEYNGGIGPMHTGFLETAATGTSIQKAWANIGGNLVRGPVLVAGTSASTQFPTNTRVATGRYRIDFPNLASKTPLGLAQATAIGADAVHCKPEGAPAAASSGSTTLRINVRCYVGSTLADSDFVVSYDTYAPRFSAGYQSDRAHANQPTVASYTPSRSFNSGSITGAPGVNVAHRTATGRYYMEQTTLSPTHSAAYVVAAGTDANYCKLESWAALGNGTGIWLRCFDSSGNAVDTQYFSTYMAGVIGPF